MKVGLEKGDKGALSQRYFYLLERLAVVKVFILLLDLDEQMVVKLFRMIFKTIKFNFIFTLTFS